MRVMLRVAKIRQQPRVHEALYYTYIEAPNARLASSAAFIVP